MAMEPPELHAPHKPHAGGVNWLELILSVAALVTSAVSIFIAVHHGEVMEKLVEANSLPFINLYSGNVVDGKNVSHFDLRNDGVGPARLKSLRFTYAGRPIRTMREYLAACCGGAEPRDGFVTSNGYSRFIPARGSSQLFAYTFDTAHPDLWRRFDDMRAELKVEACYCSVFDECYMLEPATADARRVKTCPVDPKADFVP